MKRNWNQKNNCPGSGLLLSVALILIFGMSYSTTNAQEHDSKTSAPALS